MKAIFILLFTSCVVINTKAQQTPTNNSPSAPGASGIGSGAYWSRVGNDGLGANNQNNIFGTLWNSPIYTYTNGLPRTRLNGNLNTTVNGVTKNFDGYYGISPTGYFNTNTPWSMLHLDGSNNTSFPGGGWRMWMNTGTFMRENSDGMYVGMMQVGINRSDAIINWSDDPSGSSGPDKLRFIHTGANTGDGNGQTDPRDPFALNGYEYMRMTAQGPNNSLGYASGHIGIGPLFTDLNYPRARVHMHSEDNLTNFLQISIDASTGIGQNDGTRFGVIGAQSTSNREGNALLYNQENKHLLFSTAYATPTNIDNSRERVRITQINSETNLIGGGYGIHNPWGLPLQRYTRMSISRDPLLPAVRPMATFHVGYSYSTANNYGWRNWMDQGMLVVNNAENHLYLGFKPEADNFGAHDAVVSFGKNQSQPERLRFIYSSTAGNSANANGLEIARMWSDGNEGRTGFGDFYNLAIEPQNTVHINGIAPDDQTVGGVSGLRFQDLTSNTPTTANPGLGVLAVDANGDVIYVPSGSTGFGNYCGNTQNPLTNNYEIPLNNFNIYYPGQGVPTSNAIGLGYSCLTNLPAKFNVLQEVPGSINVSTAASSFINKDIANVNSLLYTGVYGEASGLTPLNLKPTHIGGEFVARNGVSNYAVRGYVNNHTQFGADAFGGDFLADGPIGNNNGIRARAIGATFDNKGIYASGAGFASVNTGGQFASTQGIFTNYGVYSQATSANSSSTNYGIYSTASGGLNSWAGWFQGNVAVNGTPYLLNPAQPLSDANLKTNVVSIDLAMPVIKQIQPKEFYFDANNNYGIEFTDKKQYGFIAQEIELILPELVSEFTIPAKYDSLGTVISPAGTFKSLNYQSFIAILTKGIQEQDGKIDSLEALTDSQDSINNALQDQINTLYGMVTACCNNNSNLPQNNSMQQNQNGNSLDVTLTDNIPSIVLDQNVPNPFAEQTTITYTLTDGVQKAQMLFYNIEGKLIQSVDLSNNAGQGQINVFANDLSTGVYTYSLVVDGQIKGTKRMVKQ